MLYSTGSFHVLGAVLAEASGESLLAQARDRLGDPLGIEIPAWTRDPQGFYLGGNEMALSPLRHARASARCTAPAALADGPGAQPRTGSRRSLRRAHPLAVLGLDYGYGWFLGRRGRRAADARARLWRPGHLRPARAGG